METGTVSALCVSPTQEGWAGGLTELHRGTTLPGMCIYALRTAVPGQGEIKEKKRLEETRLLLMTEKTDVLNAWRARQTCSAVEESI